MLNSLGTLHSENVTLNERDRVLATMMEPKYGSDLAANLWNQDFFQSVGYGPISRKIYLSLM